MQIYSIYFKAMGGPAQIQIVAVQEAIARAQAQLAIDEIQRIESKYSRYNPHSVVSRINARADGSIHALDQETSALLTYAKSLHKKSHGLFDITSGILRRAWDFKNAMIPSEERLASLRAKVSMDRLELTGAELRLHGGEIDLGGIGKEYAVDRASQSLQKAGVAHALVNLAGDIHVLGHKPDHTPWTIGIAHPRDASRLLAEIPLHQGGLATSGDYERFIERSGRRYCHILNPRTGWSVDFWQSVSVAAPTTLLAGSLATIIMLQEGQGLQTLRESGLSFLAVNRDGEVFSDSAAASLGTETT
jgi:thiamine biosynthesis lipoprotein